MSKPSFIPGLQLSSAFYADIVKPLLDKEYAALRYSAALIGPGSEVLGFDTEMSTDHNWGPRVMLFLTKADHDANQKALKEFFRNNLPASYRGYSTNFSSPNPDDNGTQIPAPITNGPINHRIETLTIEGFFFDYMRVHIDKEMEAADWLSIPFQKLRSIIDGKVFHDGLGLEQVRSRFTWYPKDVWLYLLASGWARIGQEEHLMGRAGSVNDEIGSALIGSRLVRDIIYLAFLMERKYPPYPKWLGTGFARLSSAGKLKPILTDLVHSQTWQKRESHLTKALTYLVEIHNALRITKPLSNGISQFWTRPFRVIWGEKISEPIMESIEDPAISALAQKRHIGNVNLFCDNTDFLADPTLQPRIKSLYALELEAGGT
jgi:hypothetical protein